MIVLEGMLILLGLIGIFFIGYLTGIAKIRDQAAKLGFASYDCGKFTWSGRWYPEVQEDTIEGAVDSAGVAGRNAKAKSDGKKQPNKKG